MEDVDVSEYVEEDHPQRVDVSLESVAALAPGELLWSRKPKCAHSCSHLLFARPFVVYLHCLCIRGSF